MNKEIYQDWPVLTPYFKVSLQSTSSWSRFNGLSGIWRSRDSFIWPGWWKSRIFSLLSLVLVTKSKRMSTTLCRNSRVVLSAAGKSWQTGNKPERVVNYKLYSPSCFSDFATEIKCIWRNPFAHTPICTYLNMQFNRTRGQPKYEFDYTLVLSVLF